MATNYDGNPTASHAPAAAPGDAAIVRMSLPADGDLLNVSSIHQALQVAADWIAWLRDGRSRSAYSFTTAHAVMTNAPTEGSVLTASAITVTQGTTSIKQVAVTISINLTDGHNDVVITLTSSLAFVTTADVVVGSLNGWAGGTPTAPLVRAVITNTNEITVYAQGMGTAVTCQVSFIVQGY